MSKIRPQSVADRARALRRAQREPRGAHARHEPAGRQHGAAQAARDVQRSAVRPRAGRHHAYAARPRADRRRTPARHAAARGAPRRDAFRSRRQHENVHLRAVRRGRDGVPAEAARAPARERAQRRDPLGVDAAGSARAGARARRDRRGDRLLPGSRAPELFPAAAVHARVRVPDARRTSAAHPSADAGRVHGDGACRRARGRSQPGDLRALPRAQADPPQGGAA